MEPPKTISNKLNVPIQGDGRAKGSQHRAIDKLAQQTKYTRKVNSLEFIVSVLSASGNLSDDPCILAPN
jgi:hypothetical protein